MAIMPMALISMGRMTSMSLAPKTKTEQTKDKDKAKQADNYIFDHNKLLAWCRYIICTKC